MDIVYISSNTTPAYADYIMYITMLRHTIQFHVSNARHPLFVGLALAYRLTRFTRSKLKSRL